MPSPAPALVLVMSATRASTATPCPRPLSPHIPRQPPPLMTVPHVMLAATDARAPDDRPLCDARRDSHPLHKKGGIGWAALRGTKVWWRGRADATHFDADGLTPLMHADAEGTSLLCASSSTAVRGREKRCSSQNDNWAGFTMTPFDKLYYLLVW